MAVRGAQRHPVQLLELLDFLQSPPGKRRFAFESVQHNTLQQIAEAHVLQLGNRLQHFQKSLLDAYPCLDPLDFDSFEFRMFLLHDTNVPRYIDTSSSDYGSFPASTTGFHWSVPARNSSGRNCLASVSVSR